MSKERPHRQERLSCCPGYQLITADTEKTITFVKDKMAQPIQAIVERDAKEEEKVESFPTDVAIENLCKDPANSRLTNILYPGNHEVEMCYEGEADDLQTRVTRCKKNPGHKDFIPLKDFNKSHLPSHYHDDELMVKTIKTLAALTVQVKSEFTSLERPKFFPGTQLSYPGYNNRGRRGMKLGTGRVKYVEKHTGSDGKVWGKVCVLTAPHVVFDYSEARQTRCVLRFDENESTGVSLDCCEDWIGASIERDWCQLTYVTCDLKLVDELTEMCEHFKDLSSEVRDKYRRFADKDKLTVIVSHPHGCPKQVSVGQWTHKHENHNNFTRYWYTTCTCPGSSGAPVYRPGYDNWLCYHTHSGCSSEGNYSGVWCD